jgi:lipid-A-disaccharide synthase-like uncharacterized protein
MDATRLSQWWTEISGVELAWIFFGFIAQSMYFTRFLLQWIASERLRRSIVPETFWYFSFAGGLMLFIYAFHRSDPVIMLGQLFGLVVYARNIYLIWLHKRPENRIAALSEASFEKRVGSSVRL